MMFSEREPTTKEMQKNPELKGIIEINPLKMDRIDFLYLVRSFLFVMGTALLIGLLALLVYLQVKGENIVYIGTAFFAFSMFNGFGLPMPHEYIQLRQLKKSTLDFEETIGDIPYITEYFK